SYYSHGQFISPQELVFFPERTTGGQGGFGRFFQRSPYAPQNELPKVLLEKGSFAQAPEEFALYWLGHSSAILELEGTRILVDPVLGNAAPFPGVARRYDASPLKRKEIPPVDIVLLTHDHYDHLEYSTIRALRNRDLLFVCPLGVGSRLRGWSVSAGHIRELAWEEQLDHKGLQITAVEGIHYSGRSPWDRNATLWAGYVIQGRQHSVYWSGDSGYGEHFARIGRKYGPFDLAAIEIDGWNPGWPNTHLFPEEAVRAALDLRASEMLPVHWAVFDLALHPWDESIRELMKYARRDSLPVLTPIMGQKVIPGKTETNRWWEELPH
ncbi:MAG: MBL fold metallo-hydrolase, partial [Rikenellaceae bacterium]|nr:MBL fold metallo-hydrolase [Rikenellaceae bacterium]